MRRKNELSFLNIIFCVLVVFIHVTSAAVTGLSKGSWQYGVFFVPWRLSAFVVQGFIFLSGLKMFLKTDGESYKRYYWSRFIKIVVPYMLAVTLFYAYFLWRNYFGFNLRDFFGYIIKGDLVSHFYFVVAIVQFYILKPIWKLVIEKVPPVAAIVGSILIMFLCKYTLSSFLYNDRLFTTYLAYWLMGCYAGKHYHKVLNHIKRYKTLYMWQFAVVAILEASVSYKQFVYGGMKFLEELHFLYSISAVLFTFAVATLVSDKAMNIRFLKKIDSASFYIYLIHPLFIFITDGFLSELGIVDIALGFVIRSITTYLLSILISIAYLEIKGRVKRKRKCQNSEKQN